MSFDTLTKKEIMVLLKKVQDIAAMLKDISDIINSETSDPSEPEENVVQIIPNVINQFKKNQTVPMNIVNIVTLYENWTQDLYGATITNKGRLKNKAVKRHIEEAYGICKSVENVLKQIIAQ